MRARRAVGGKGRRRGDVDFPVAIATTALQRSERLDTILLLQCFALLCIFGGADNYYHFSITSITGLSGNYTHRTNTHPDERIQTQRQPTALLKISHNLSSASPSSSLIAPKHSHPNTIQAYNAPLQLLLTPQSSSPHNPSPTTSSQSTPRTYPSIAWTGLPDFSFWIWICGVVAWTG